jgi:hypothetical protein
VSKLNGREGPPHLGVNLFDSDRRGTKGLEQLDESRVESGQTDLERTLGATATNHTRFEHTRRRGGRSFEDGVTCYQEPRV